MEGIKQLHRYDAGDVVRFKIAYDGDDDQPDGTYAEGVDEIVWADYDGHGRCTYGLLATDLIAYEEELILINKAE